MGEEEIPWEQWYVLRLSSTDEPDPLTPSAFLQDYQRRDTSAKVRSRCVRIDALTTTPLTDRNLQIDKHSTAL